MARPFDTAPRYLVRANEVAAKKLGFAQVVTATRVASHRAAVAAHATPRAAKSTAAGRRSR